MWSRPLSSGTTSAGPGSMRVERRLEARRLGGHDQHIGRFDQPGHDRRVGREVAEADAAYARPRRSISRWRVVSRATTVTSTPASASAAATKPPTPPGPSTAMDVTCGKAASIDQPVMRRAPIDLLDRGPRSGDG